MTRRPLLLLALVAGLGLALLGGCAAPVKQAAIDPSTLIGTWSQIAKNSSGVEEENVFSFAENDQGVAANFVRSKGVASSTPKGIRWTVEGDTLKIAYLDGTQETLAIRSVKRMSFDAEVVGTSAHLKSGTWKRGRQ